MNDSVVEGNRERYVFARNEYWKRNLNYLLFFFDTTVLLVSSLVIHRLLGLEKASSPPLHYGIVAVLTMLAYIFYSSHRGLYDWHSFRRKLAKPAEAYGTLLSTFGTILLIGFVSKETDQFSRLWLGLWFASFATYLVVSRFTFAQLLSRPSCQSVMQRCAVIIGAGDLGCAVLDHMLKFDDTGVKIIGFLDDRRLTRLPTNDLGLPVIGTTARIADLIRRREIDLVIIALPWTADARIAQLVRQLSKWAVDIYLAPERLGIRYADRPLLRVGGLSVLNLKARPISEWNALIKRAEDLCIAVPAILLLSPVLIVTALAIRLESKGPVLFIQKRYGFNNELIRVYKFRSMHMDREDHNAEQLTKKDDPRVTAVGRFIRKTSIDELPQLFNVLEGTMSIVGPRPHATRAKAGERLYEDAVEDYASRHRVKPGITGWAQCKGWRGETDTEEKIIKRVELDLYYIENWSVLLDLLTILRTLLLLVKKQESAY